MTLNWEKYGIDISKQRGGKMLCPNCSHTRKHSKDLCLSVDLNTGMYNCHNDCGFKGMAVDIKPKKEYQKPVPRVEKLGEKMLSWFENERKISNNTLLRFKVTEAKEWMPQPNKEMNCICFNYYRDDKLVNIKFRDAAKGFKMISGAELIFYNLDSINGENSCIIVEGEIDCMTFYECGIYNVVSVPNGASKGSQKLEYLDNCWKYFEAMERIVLAVDNDEAGNSLRDELARRLGKEKCFTVTYPEGCKDANECLLKYGPDSVTEVIEGATEIPLEGIMTMEEIYPIITDWYLNGYPKGAKARIEGFDDLMSFTLGQLTCVTGIPGHGKDEFVNLIMANLAKYENWSWGLCEFEESPPQTVSKLIEKFTGKSFDFRVNPEHRINIEEFEYGVGMVDKYFKFVNTQEVETDLDGILKLAEQMVKRYGIKGFRLNPWNWVESGRPAYQSETEFISNCLSKIILFAKRFQVHFILIAHTVKIGKGMDGKYIVPTLYNINGSANFFNKTHNGFVVYRHYDTNNVDVVQQKVKQSWLGTLGTCSFSYDTYTRQYRPITTGI